MLDERMEEQNRKKLRPPPEDEETEEEQERPRFAPLNVRKSAFDSDEGNRTQGINTMPSVFRRQAVFHTEE